MSRPDDSILTSEQLSNVQRHANRLLLRACAHGRFPTPISDLMAAAKLTVVDDEVLDASLLYRFLRKARTKVATLKSALSKVLGLFEPHERLVIIDKIVPPPKRPFVKLHEAGHGFLPHQSGLYALIHDCEKTLDPDTTDLFEREANVFASEVMFQGEAFAQEARQYNFSKDVPIKLAKKFGASNYAAFRRYVTTNPVACCLVVLNPVTLNQENGFKAEVRRVVVSRTFETIYDPNSLLSTVTATHPLGSVVPIRKRMVSPHEIVLMDRNGAAHICVAEAFDTTHQILILIRDNGTMKSGATRLPRLKDFVTRKL